MKSYFFDGVQSGTDADGYPTYDREYYAADHAAYYNGLLQNGVVVSTDASACLVTYAGNKLTIGAGSLYINGYKAKAEGDDVISTLDLAVGYYRLMARLDTASDVRSIAPKLVFGSTSAYPAVTRSGSIYDLCLASVRVTSVGGTPTLIDTRADTSLCGYSGMLPLAHAATGTDYGIGTASNYGHVKLSDSVETMSGASGGIAATPTAVKAVYDTALMAVELADAAGFVTGKYNGSNSASRTISVGFTPSAVLVVSKSGTMVSSSGSPYGGLAVADAASAGVVIVDGGFDVYYTYGSLYTNSRDNTYNYIAFK